MSSARRPVDLDPEDVERVRQLDAAAADVRMVRRHELDDRVVGRPAFRPSTRPAVDLDLAGENQRARPFARRDQPAFDIKASSRRLADFISTGVRPFLVVPPSAVRSVLGTELERSAAA